jgi:hypothetical protein
VIGASSEALYFTRKGPTVFPLFSICSRLNKLHPMITILLYQILFQTFVCVVSCLISLCCDATDSVHQPCSNLCVFVWFALSIFTSPLMLMALAPILGNRIALFYFHSNQLWKQSQLHWKLVICNCSAFNPTSFQDYGGKVVSLCSLRI